MRSKTIRDGRKCPLLKAPASAFWGFSRFPAAADDKTSFTNTKNHPSRTGHPSSIGSELERLQLPWGIACFLLPGSIIGSQSIGINSERNCSFCATLVLENHEHPCCQKSYCCGAGQKHRAIEEHIYLSTRIGFVTGTSRVIQEGRLSNLPKKKKTSKTRHKNPRYHAIPSYLRA